MLWQLCEEKSAMKTISAAAAKSRHAAKTFSAAARRGGGVISGRHENESAESWRLAIWY